MKGRYSIMVRNRIVEAIQEATGNAEIAFKISSIVKFQKFTEMKDVDEVDVLNFKRGEVL